MANTVRMMVIAIFRVIKAPYIDRNLSIINCYAETVHVFRNFVHVIKNRLVGAPVHVIEKTVYVGSVRISVSGEVIPGAAQRGCPLYLRCSMPDLMR